MGNREYAVAEIEEMPLPKRWDGKLGDTVEIDHPNCLGKVYRVAKLNPVNVTVEDEFGARVRVDRYMLRATDKTYTLRPATEQITLGTVVRFNRAFRNVKTTDLFVVFKTNGDKFNVARLGGDGGRYLRNVNRDGVTVIDPATITAE